MMVDVSNSEMTVQEAIEAWALEAAKLARKRDAAASAEDREVLDRQLREVERRIESFRRRLRR